MRVTWIGPADQGPDALWLARLPDTQPILMPSLAGNVTDAWLLLRFQIKGESRWGYRPHDVLVSVNGDWLHWFRNTIPEGRYLFPLDPSNLTTSAGNPAFNHVQIDSWHMNGGHYITGTDYQIMTRSAWGETFAFAADEQDARQAADRPNLNHDKPDLVVLANGMDVPAEPPPSGKTDFRVVVANVGEADSRPAGLLMLHSPKDESGGKPLARAEVPALRPGERWTGHDAAPGAARSHHLQAPAGRAGLRPVERFAHAGALERSGGRAGDQTRGDGRHSVRGGGHGRRGPRDRSRFRRPCRRRERGRPLTGRRGRRRRRAARRRFR